MFFRTLYFYISLLLKEQKVSLKYLTMISFISLHQDLPFLLFEEKYNLAVKNNEMQMQLQYLLMI